MIFEVLLIELSIIRLICTPYSKIGHFQMYLKTDLKMPSIKVQ
jgi:hypothetical protein